ncbi:MAG: ABC transporter permease [Gemmatimonadetes bacterium]|nr:ABC transporter permease [Gemmatimonadota bacterium]
MSVAGLVFSFRVRDLVRSPWLAAYALGFFAIGESLFWFGGTADQVVLSLLNLVLTVVPLAALVFGVVYVYSTREFTELLLAQPIPRRQLFVGLVGGLTVPLSAAGALGMALPFVLHAGRQAVPVGPLVTLLVAAIGLTAACTALAVLIALWIDDRLRGIGVALGTWLALTLLYDAGVLAIAAAYDRWPLDKVMIGLMLANPVDIARSVVISQLDIPAMMGYSGAVFRQAFGSSIGVAIALLALVSWALVPFLFARRRFERRDF